MSKFITYPKSLNAEYYNNPEIPQAIGFVEAYQRAKSSYKKDFIDTAVIRDDNPKDFAFGGYGVTCTLGCIRSFRKEGRSKVEFLWRYESYGKGNGGGYKLQPLVHNYQK